MPFLLFLLILAIPALEIAVFIQVGDLIGVIPTLLGIVVTAVIGAALLRHQGLQTLRRVQESLDRGELPVADVFDGLCIVLAGALLLTPGFVTDAIGLSLFLPPVRRVLMALLARHLAARGGAGGFTHRPTPSSPFTSGEGPTIDGDYTDVTPPERKGADGRERLPHQRRH